MIATNTESALIALQEESRNDHDGGYGLASAWCQYRHGLVESDAKEWDQVVIKWVAERSPSRWAVALESLATVGGPQVDEALVGILHESGRDAEFRAHVMEALVRRGYVDDFLIAEILDSARRRHALGLPNLARLVALVPDLVGTTADCFVSAMASGLQKYVEANIPPFVYAGADSQFELLVRLVAEIYTRNAKAGSEVVAMIVNYVNKPFVLKRIGTKAAAELAAALESSTKN